VPCNRATKNDELLVDTFARFTTCLDSQKTMRDVNDRFKRLFEQFPDLDWALRMSNNQRRRLRRANPGKAGAVIHFPEEFRYRFNRVAFKLGAALQYKHADGRIIPPDGGCMVDIVPNQDPELNRRGDEILRQLADRRANPVANRRSLSEQFVYDYWSCEEDVGLYAVRLRKHLRLTIAVFMDSSGFDGFNAIGGMGPRMVKPFDPIETQSPDCTRRHLCEGVYRWRVLQGIG
jgi:hypothetical protein